MLRSEVVPLNMSVDAALKYIVSMGVVAPPAGPILNAADAAAQGATSQVSTLSSDGVNASATSSRSSD
jgi:uncharacterized membrane protein